MGIFIFTDKSAGSKNGFPKTAQIQNLAALSKHSPKNDDVSYIDVSGFESTELKKLQAFIKDMKGESSKEEGAKFLSSNIKLPASGAFPGWKKMQTGMNMPFYLMYCSVEGKTALDSRFGEKIVAAIHKKFIEFLQDNFHGSDALLWMNTGREYLFLIPAKQKCIEAGIKACMNMLISAPLFTLECLDITMPVNFIFALHYGSINYKPPGKTGTVVSDAINFVFHLGTKKAEMGRITISGELPGVSIPKQLQDCFVSSKDFEGRKIWQSKKFEYPKNWV